ncbi:hypothetical protein COBT_000648 [Conglomerata obtusa]
MTNAINTIGIIPRKNSKTDIQKLYDLLLKRLPSNSLFIIQAESITCPLKQTGFDLYIILCETCNHVSERCLVIMTDTELEQIVEGIYNKVSNIEEKICKKLDDKCKIEVKNDNNIKNTLISNDKNIENAKFMRTGNNLKNTNTFMDNVHNEFDILHKKDNKKLFTTDSEVNDTKQNNGQIKTTKCTKNSFLDRFEDEDQKSKFLISRIAKIEKAKSKTLFSIFFTTPFYNLAYKIRTFLQSKEKIAYLIHLNDISYERLSCIDNTEVVVVVDCQPHFDIDLLVPLLVPFDVLLSFDETFMWRGEYDLNFFDVCGDKIVKVENSIEILDKVYDKISLVNVDYENEELDCEIYEGRKGIANEYENEGH